MHYACARSDFSRAMGVSPNQRLIRVVHASHGLPNRGFQIVITTHVAYLYAPSLFLDIHAVLIKQTLGQVKIEKFT